MRVFHEKPGQLPPCVAYHIDVRQLNVPSECDCVSFFYFVCVSFVVSFALGSALGRMWRLGIFFFCLYVEHFLVAGEFLRAQKLSWRPPPVSVYVLFRWILFYWFRFNFQLFFFAGVLLL